MCEELSYDGPSTPSPEAVFTGDDADARADAWIHKQSKELPGWRYKCSAEIDPK